MAGPEVELTVELAAAIAGTEPTTRQYLQTDGSGALLSGQGSQNIPLLAWGVRLLLGAAGAREMWMKFFTYFRTAWMGSELCSFIYGMWHLIPVLAVARWAQENGDVELAEGAAEWLLYYGCLAELCSDGEGRIVWAGMRSAGHQPLPGWREWAHALGMGRDLTKWMAAGKAAGLGMKMSWMWDALHTLAPTLQEGYAPLRQGGDAQSLLPALGLAAPLRIVRTEEGVACLLGRNTNPNTPPWGALVSVAGELSCLPDNGGRRIRQQFDDMTCVLDGSTIRYTSSLYGDAELPLPGGAVLLDLCLPDGTANGRIPLVPLRPPEHGSLRTRMTALAAGVEVLQLPRNQLALQQAVVAELRAGVLRRPPAAIAADVASFGIGAGQAQAPAWRTLVADIEALAQVGGTGTV